MKTKKSVSVLLALLLIFAVACTTVSAVALLNAIVDTVDASFPAIAAAANLDPATTDKISTYLTAVSQAVQSATTILQSNATAAEKAAQIAAAFAVAVQPDLPAGTPRTIVAVIAAVTNAVENFLKAIAPAPAPTPTPAVRAKASLKMSTTDKVQLAKIAARAAVDQQKATALVHTVEPAK